MYESKDQILLHHGYALGCGGYMDRDGTRIPIDAIAPGVISIVGGKCKTEQPEWQFTLPAKGKYPKFSIMVSKAVTEVFSTEDENQWTTTAQSTVHGLNLCDVIRADRVTSKLTSVHLKRKKGQKKKEASISFAGSEIRGLSVNGVPCGVTLDDELDRFQTHGELKDVLGGKLKPKPRPDFPALACKLWSEQFKPRNLLDVLKKDKKKDPLYMQDLVGKYVSDKITRCSIVADLDIPPETRAVKHGYSIEIEGFGRIFFGEMRVSDGMKRLDMIRFDLGCDDCGGGTVPSSAVNGEPMP